MSSIAGLTTRLEEQVYMCSPAVVVVICKVLVLVARSRLESVTATALVESVIISITPLPILLVQVKDLRMALSVPLTLEVAVQVREKVL